MTSDISHNSPALTSSHYCCPRSVSPGLLSLFLPPSCLTLLSHVHIYDCLRVSCLESYLHKCAAQMCLFCSKGALICVFSPTPCFFKDVTNRYCFLKNQICFVIRHFHWKWMSPLLGAEVRFEVSVSPDNHIAAFHLFWDFFLLFCCTSCRGQGCLISVWMKMVWWVLPCRTGCGNDYFVLYRRQQWHQDS